MNIQDGDLEITWPLTPESGARLELEALARRKGGELHVSEVGKVFAFWIGTPPARLLGDAGFEKMSTFLNSLPDVDKLPAAHE